jgi:hypothetical protein
MARQRQSHISVKLLGFTFCLWRNNQTRAYAAPLLRFLDNTQTYTHSVGLLWTNTTAGFEPVIPAIQRSQTYAFVCLVGHRAGDLSGEWGGRGSYPSCRIRRTGKIAEPWVTGGNYKPLPAHLILPNKQDCRLGKRTARLLVYKILFLRSRSSYVQSSIKNSTNIYICERL